MRSRVGGDDAVARTDDSPGLPRVDDWELVCLAIAAWVIVIVLGVNLVV
jgi:hypothetical protein